MKIYDFDFSQIITNQTPTLFDKKITSVIIEGGRQLLEGFIALNLWDEARVCVANVVKFNLGIPIPKLTGQKPVNSIEIENDSLLIYQNSH